MQTIAEQMNVSQEQFDYLTRGNKSPFCKCGAIRLIKKSKQSKIGLYLYRTCGRTECEPHYGKKRPEHSKIMKDMVINGSDAFKATLMKKGNLFNPNVNGISFKQKRLERHGIFCEDSQIEVEYSKLLGNLITSISRRKRDIVSRFNQWESEFKQLILIVTDGKTPSKEWIDALPDDEINIIWKRIHGINTIRNWSKTKSTRNTFFKQELLSGFIYNTKKQDSVFTRSGLEKEWIIFFESNKIPWCYEPFVIESVKKDSFHLPDFLIEINGSKILLEAKGGFYNQNITDYIENKVAAAMKFAAENGLSYILTQQKPSLNPFEGAMIFKRIEDA